MSDSPKWRLREGALTALASPSALPVAARAVPVAEPRDSLQGLRDPMRGRPPADAPESPTANDEPVQSALKRLREGDADGLSILYDRYYRDLLRYVNGIVQDSHEAEDIVQNVFAKLITVVDKFDQKDVPFTAWLLRIARNAALDHLRARRAIPTEEVRFADVGESQISPDRDQDLRHALERLPVDQREVLVLRHLVGLSPPQIAATLDATEDAVAQLQRKALRRVQRERDEDELALKLLLSD